MATDPWAEFEEVTTAANPAGGIYTIPDPRGAGEDARDERTLQLAEEAAGWRREEAEAKRAERARLEQEQAVGIQDSLAQMRRVVQAAQQAKDLSRSGWFATGFGAETARGIGGTSAADVASLLNTIGSNTAFDRLQRMREQSPTGGALGAVSEIELQLLRDSIASLNQSQSDAQFQQNMDKVIEAYQRVINRLEPAVTEQGGSANTPEMRGGLPVGTEIEFNIDRAGEGGFDRDAALREMYGIDANQEATITAFWNANRGNQNLSEQAVLDYYSGIGVAPPSPDRIREAIEAAKSGATFGGMSTEAAEQEWNRRVEERAAQNAELYGEPGAVDLAGHGVSAGLSDEAQGIGAAIFAMAQGKSPAEAYRFANDVRDYELARARENSGWAGTAAEVVGNAASLGLGTNLPSAAGAAVREGAVAGAVPGFGYGEGSGESITGAGLGAGTGALLGRFLGGRGGNTSGGTTPPTTPGGRVVQAADDLNRDYGTNIIPLPADVGGTTTRRATGGIAQSTFGAKPIVEASQRVTSETGGAVKAIAERVGTPAELEAAGNAALTGAQKWMKTTGTRVNSLYTKARKLSDGVTVPLTNARRTLDDHIRELESTPGGAEGLEKLRALQEEIAGDYTVDGIKRMRTTLRDRYMGDGLRRTDIERRVGQIIDAAEQDVADGLIAAGKPEAAQAWSQAAAEHRKRLQVIDNVLAPIIGKRSDAPRSGEQIMRAIDGLTKTDNAKLAKFIRALPTEEANTVRSTVISRLGTRNAEADDFSLSTFLTQWGKMTPGAKRTMFGGELTEALDKVATVASGSQQAQRFANFSNTGSTTWTAANMGGAIAGVVPGLIMIAGQYGAGRLLASPAFARWLARMPKNPAAARKHIDGLERIAASETAIAQDALGLQRQLIDALEGGSLQLAAEPVPLPADQGSTADSQRTAGAAR